jgi:uncharacterized membrane protein YfcA
MDIAIALPGHNLLASNGAKNLAEKVWEVIQTSSLVYPLSGLFVGLIVGLTGVGGGSLMTPLLMAFGIHPATAVGSDLLYAAATKTVGTAAHATTKTVDWTIVRRLALGSVPATIIMMWVLAHVGTTSPQMAHAIKFVLGIALLLTAVSIFFRVRLLRFVEQRLGSPSDRNAAILTVISGATLGVLVSLSSVGAGAVGVTVLLMLYPRIPLARIVGSDIAHAVPLTLLAGAGHWWLGDVNWALVASLLTGSIPGILAGSFLAPRLPETGLRPALAAILLIVGANLVNIRIF